MLERARAEIEEGNGPQKFDSLEPPWRGAEGSVLLKLEIRRARTIDVSGDI